MLVNLRPPTLPDWAQCRERERPLLSCLSPDMYHYQDHLDANRIIVSDHRDLCDIVDVYCINHTVSSLYLRHPVAKFMFVSSESRDSTVNSKHQKRRY